MPADLPPDLAAAFEGLELREHQPGCTFGIISERDLDVRLSCNCGVDEHNTRVDALAAQIAEKLIAQDRARTKAIDERLHVEQLIATRDAEHRTHVERLHRERDERGAVLARAIQALWVYNDSGLACEFCGEFTGAGHGDDCSLVALLIDPTAAQSLELRTDFLDRLRERDEEIATLRRENEALRGVPVGLQTRTLLKMDDA